jgi:phosphoglycolate phosphatase
MTAILFDLDGTLIDSMPQIHRVILDVLALEGLGEVDRLRLQSYVGNGLPALVAQLLDGLGAGGDAVLRTRVTEEILARYTDSHGLTRLYPGARAALEALAAAGHRLGVVTNKPIAPAEAVLAHFGLTALFQTVIGGDSLPERKPHPRPLLHAGTRLGGGRMVFIGDSEVDAQTAEAAQVPFALFTEGYRKGPIESLPHSARFDHFDALPDIVAGLLTRAG